ncbi:glycosyltransferase family 2 protein [Halegenticoccus tardaugens]|uniref:glycosyltransferase family 2 protein n=1 Tax=Halegenticoccus tardaugens TaxID=2071624 RepID=UPI00100AC073|nr:glycosyltransferase family 2 protein [Halegenticoccus tardaugens]
MTTEQTVDDVNAASTNGDRATVIGTDPGDALLLQEDSEQTPTLSVVMPTLNEEQGIAECIDRIKNALGALGVPGEIIVSDSSTDRTPEIAREMGAVVVEPDAPGYGYAYQYAFEHARGEYIAIGDADTTYDFEELPKLYELVTNGDADMAMGSRLDGEIKKGAMPPLHQHIGNPLLTKFLNVFYGAGVSDAHSGMRVISRDALKELDLKTDGMEFASEMIMDAGARGLTIEELPITYHPREGEATLDSFRDGWRHVKFMLVNAPGYLFSVPGFVLSLFGAFVMALAYFSVPINGISLGVHSVIAGSLFTIVGTQVVSLGAFATVAGDPIRAPEDPVTEYLTQKVQLEHGATFGLCLFGVGAGFAGVLAIRWIASDFTQLPFLMGDVVALTAMVLGLQIFFSSFFLSAIAE